MVKVCNNKGKVIDIPLGRFPNRCIHQLFVNIFLYETVSVINIMITTIMLSNIMYSHTKLIVLFYGEHEVIISV